MGIEIERKFLVTGDDWRTGAQGFTVRQGFLCTAPGRTVRARVAAGRGYLTIKGQHAGLTRAEFEYEIPVEDADFILDKICQPTLIEKTRHRVAYGELTWEVDEFAGLNAGLIVAEVELESETQPVDLPPWVGREVSADYRYTNAYLSQHPYTTWSEAP